MTGVLSPRQNYHIFFKNENEFILASESKAEGINIFSMWSGKYTDRTLDIACKNTPPKLNNQQKTKKKKNKQKTKKSIFYLCWLHAEWSLKLNQLKHCYKKVLGISKNLVLF